MTSEQISGLLAKATPGPWVVSTTGLTNTGQRPISGSDQRIALADCQSDLPRKELWQAECKEREANAALIALAPDLAAEVLRLRAIMAAAKDVADALQQVSRGCDTGQVLWNNARAALSAYRAKEQAND